MTYSILDNFNFKSSISKKSWKIILNTLVIIYVIGNIIGMVFASIALVNSHKVIKYKFYTCDTDDKINCICENTTYGQWIKDPSIQNDYDCISFFKIIMNNSSDVNIVIILVICAFWVYIGYAFGLCLLLPILGMIDKLHNCCYFNHVLLEQIPFEHVPLEQITETKN